MMLRIHLNATLTIHFCQEEAPYTVALAQRFVKWKDDNIFHDLTDSRSVHAVSNNITLGFSSSFFFYFLLDNFHDSSVYFACLCVVLTRLIHFCRLFFHKWPACGRMEMIWLKWLQGHCGWLLGCPGWSLGSCQVVCGCDAPSNQCHFGIWMRKRLQFCTEGLWRAAHLFLILYFQRWEPMIPPVMRLLECLWDPEFSFPR